MNELSKNIYLTDSIVTELVGDPKLWLTDHDSMTVRYVGGIHNLSVSDKKKWAQDEGHPLRIIETETGREEVWFPLGSKSPEYLCLDPDGKLTSHMKFDRSQPTLVQAVSQSKVPPGLPIMATFSMWYEGDNIHRPHTKHYRQVPAVTSSKICTSIKDDEYINAIIFTVYKEFWTDGIWDRTAASDMNILFTNTKLNTPDTQKKANDWLAAHCTGGFFPFADQLFGEVDEEFMFLADICSLG